MLYKYKQLLESFSNSKDLKYIYHYIWKEDHIKNIIKSKKLISINKLGNDHEGTAKYKNRDGTTHPPEYYYELSYNKLYKDLIGKPYTTHGLYFTTTDFFGFESKIVGRVKVPIETIFIDTETNKMYLPEIYWFMEKKIYFCLKSVTFLELFVKMSVTKLEVTINYGWKSTRNW